MAACCRFIRSAVSKDSLDADQLTRISLVNSKLPPICDFDGAEMTGGLAISRKHEIYSPDDYSASGS